MLPGDLAAIVTAYTGIDFGAATIARYLSADCWQREPHPAKGGVHYFRPTPKKGRAAGSRRGPSPNSETTLPDVAGEQAARSKRDRPGTNPTGTGDTHMKTTIPLNKLILSPLNVRKTDGEVGIEALADSIHEKGLLQNLVVAEALGGKGLHEVGGGGRRWRALSLNVKKKRIARDWDVPVKIVSREALAEASLAENLREDMNPADEVEAFAAIIQGYAEGGMNDRREQLAHCARRFGTTVRYIEQRVRLADLAPAILDALRKGEITLDSAKAYAGHPDQAVQLKIFEAEKKKPYNAHSPGTIRDAIAGKVYAADNKLVIYVGLDAYRDAGGRVEADLFFGAEDREVLLDPSIVDRLAREKGDIEVGKLAQGEGWADGVLSLAKQSWQLPDPPAGFKAAYNAADRLTPDQRDASIAIFEVSAAGGLRRVESCFIKAEPAPPANPGKPFDQAAWEAEQRKEAIEYKAARLAAPPVAGTPLEGRTFWPDNANDDYVPSIAKEEDGTFVVALLVRIPAADVQERFAEAEALYERELAAKAEEEEAKEAGAEPTADEDAGGEAAGTPPAEVPAAETIAETAS